MKTTLEFCRVENCYERFAFDKQCPTHGATGITAGEKLKQQEETALAKYKTALESIKAEFSCLQCDSFSTTPGKCLVGHKFKSRTELSSEFEQ